MGSAEWQRSCFSSGGFGSQHLELKTLYLAFQGDVAYRFRLFSNLCNGDAESANLCAPLEMVTLRPLTSSPETPSVSRNHSHTHLSPHFWEPLPHLYRQVAGPARAESGFLALLPGPRNLYELI